MKTKKVTALQRLRPKQDADSLARDSRGLSTVEYLILLVIIAVAGISVWGKFAKTVETKTNSAGASIETMK